MTYDGVGAGMAERAFTQPCCGSRSLATLVSSARTIITARFNRNPFCRNGMSVALALVTKLMIMKQFSSGSEGGMCLSRQDVAGSRPEVALHTSADCLLELHAVEVSRSSGYLGLGAIERIYSASSRVDVAAGASVPTLTMPLNTKRSQEAGYTGTDKVHPEWATGEAGGPLRVRVRRSVQMDRWELGRSR